MITIDQLCARMGITTPDDADRAGLQRALLVANNKITAHDLVVGQVLGGDEFSSEDEAMGEALGKTLGDIAQTLGELIASTAENPESVAKQFANQFTKALMTSLLTTNRLDDLKEIISAARTAAAERAAKSYPPEAGHGNNVVH